MPNRLSAESSPYLLQHADNPVDWYAWGPDAFAAAKAADMPIFLSIGYSSCHWCHVMAHESFEDEKIAAELRESFISVKVDREERPDIDSVYMTALQIFLQMVGSPEGGGWPLSMFLTPEGKPFYGGTYWPPESRYGRPGFSEVLTAIAGFWRDRREDTCTQADRITQYLQMEAGGLKEEPDAESADKTPAIDPVVSGKDVASKEEAEAFIKTDGADMLQQAASKLESVFDPQFGGFGQAPKFPHPMDLRLMLRLARRFGNGRMQEMATFTLDCMAAGGIFDQLGGGFHRYSVDARWLVPHFEKMLYDNGMLAAVYVEAYQLTGEESYADTARGTLDYILRELTDPDGGFYSAQDADTEGEEGKFYVWTPAEINDALGEETAARFSYVYDISDAGNFEGKNIPHLPRTWQQCATLLKFDVNELQTEMVAARAKLLAARTKRVRPGLDDKVLVNWNALAIEALAMAGAALREEKYVKAASRAADFVLENMRDENGRLLHSWRQGQARFPAYLDDHACFINALVRLYEATLDSRYADEALQLANVTLEHFADANDGGFFYTADDTEQLIARQKDVHDNPTPSGNGMLATALLRLGQLAGRDDLLSTGRTILHTFRESMRRMSMATGQMLTALDWALGPTKEVVVAAKDEALVRELLGELQAKFVPHCVTIGAWPGASAQSSAALSAALEGKESGDEPAAFVCRQFACEAPAKGREDILARWSELDEGSGT